MNLNNNPDRTLDQALSEYRDAEPHAGIEDRILRRIATQPGPSSRRWTWFLVTAAAAAVVVVTLWLGFRHHPHQQPVATSVTQPAQQATANASHIETPASPSAQSHPAASTRATSPRPASSVNPQIAKAARAKPAPKQFPSPAPLTSEEHALLTLAAGHPDALLSRPDDVDKLRIAPIEIKPLAPDAGAPQGEQP
jgi:hypothetical protein